MKNILTVLFISTLIFSLQAEEQMGKKEAIELVTLTVKAVEKQGETVFQQIIAGVHPYKNSSDSSFYVFVYDTDVVIVAHPNASLVGRSYKGKPDVKGNKFRDTIVETALTKGKGWVDYFYQKPEETGIFEKTTYVQLAVAPNGKKYIVCCGIYKEK